MERVLLTTAIVVVYNTYCGESPTCIALEKLCNNNINVLIYDNSITDYNNSEYCKQHGWLYLGGNGNVGLSKAYNAAIDFLRLHTDTNLICLFDDDTNIEAEYFKLLLQEAKNDSQTSVFVPVILSNNRIVSPFIAKKGHRAKMFKTHKKLFENNHENIAAINSCMAIRLSVFENYRYDENIFLDGIDHKFILDIKKQNHKIKVFNYTCKHSLSAMEKPSRDSALSRFQIFSNDYRYIFKDNKLAYFRLVGKRALRLTMQYKTLRFIRLFLKRSK